MTKTEELTRRLAAVARKMAALERGESTRTDAINLDHDLTRYSDDSLRRMAKHEGKLGEKARAELRSRGVTIADPASTEGQALARMFADSRGNVANVSRVGRVQTFGGPVEGARREDARPQRAGQGLPPDERARMDAKMGLRRRAPEVRRDGRHQVFETMTSDDAKAALRRDANR